MKRPLIQLILIQLKEFYREPGILFWGFLFPILMAWGLGIAFTSKGEMVRNIALINSSSENPAILNILKNTVKSKYKDNTAFEKIIKDKKLGTTKYRFIITDWEKAIVYLKRGTITVIIKNENQKNRFFFDPMNNEAQLTYLHLSSLLNNNSINNNSDNIVPLTKTGTRYIDFLIPGLIAMGVMMSIMWGVCYSLVEKRSKKLLRRLIATPMKKTSFLISHFVSRLLLSATEAFILFIFAHYYFDIKVEGNVLALLTIFISGVIAFTGIAVFVSSRTEKTEIGNGLVNAVVMPMMVLSGVFFSYHNFPDSVIPFIQKLPLTLLADGIRSVFIEGAGIKEILSQVITLLGTGTVFFISGLKIYKWY